MTKPTQQSLDEAVQLAEDDYGVIDTKLAIRALALTLDKLHERKPPISDAQSFWAELMVAKGDYPAYARASNDALTDGDESAIALIESKFAELLGQAPQEPAWIEWHGGECPVPAGSDCEVRFRDGDASRDNTPEGWCWGECGSATITQYRVWP